MKPHFGLWIISTFLITTSLAEEIPEKTVSKFRSKRFFDNFDYINTSVAEGTPDIEPERYIQYIAI